MGLLDDLKPPSRYKPRCKVAVIKATLDTKDQQLLEQYLDDIRWSSTALSRALESKGIEVPHQSIGRHRRNDCTCSKN
jgi:hypothetical protein